MTRAARRAAAIDARLHLLDRQIVDRDGRRSPRSTTSSCASARTGGSAVAALLAGPGAFGPRLGGRLGRWTVSIWRRLRPDADPPPGRIDAALVTGTDSAVHVSAAVGELGLDGLERWVRRYVVEPIPGSGHAAE